MGMGAVVGKPPLTCTCIWTPLLLLWLLLLPWAEAWRASRAEVEEPALWSGPAIAFWNASVIVSPPCPCAAPGAPGPARKGLTMVPPAAAAPGRDTAAAEPAAEAGATAEPAAPAAPALARALGPLCESSSAAWPSRMVIRAGPLPLT